MELHLVPHRALPGTFPTLAAICRASSFCVVIDLNQNRSRAGHLNCGDHIHAVFICDATLFAWVMPAERSNVMKPKKQKKTKK